MLLRTGHSPPTTTTFGCCAKHRRNSSRPCMPAPATTALPFQSPGPVYFSLNSTSLKLCVLMMREPKPVERPLQLSTCVFYNSLLQHSHEVVSGVPDNEAEVMFPCKIHASLDLLLLCGHYDIMSIEATCASFHTCIGR
jgi:hypothetical protein